jgi:hypothetical protein
MAEECNVVKKNLGLGRCNTLPSMPRTQITTPMNWKIPKATLDAGSAAIETYIQDAMLAPLGERIYLWPNFSSFENISEEATYQDTPLSYKKVRDGNYRFRFGISENMCIHKAMYTHRASSGRVIIVDIENQMIGTKNSAGDFMGLTINGLNTEKFKFNDGSVATESPILVALANNKELDKDGALIEADFVGTLNRLVDVELTVVGTPSATTIVVDVKVKCDGTPLNGLVVGDFILLKNDGTSQTITSLAEVDGRYTLSGTGWVSGSLDLDTPDQLSIQAYESLGPVTITIS